MPSSILVLEPDLPDNNQCSPPLIDTPSSPNPRVRLTAAPVIRFDRPTSSRPFRRLRAHLPTSSGTLQVLDAHPATHNYCSPVPPLSVDPSPTSCLRGPLHDHPAGAPTAPSRFPQYRAKSPTSSCASSRRAPFRTLRTRLRASFLTSAFAALSKADLPCGTRASSRRPSRDPTCPVPVPRRLLAGRFDKSAHSKPGRLILRCTRSVDVGQESGRTATPRNTFFRPSPPSSRVCNRWAISGLTRTIPSAARTRQPQNGGAKARRERAEIQK